MGLQGGGWGGLFLQKGKKGNVKWQSQQQKLVSWSLPARSGPIVTIVRLEVEKAMIVLMSFWVRAQMVANSVDREPGHRHVVRAVLLEVRMAWV